MRRNSTSSMGAMHPILFFLVVYGIALFLALFVCRTVYYSINGDAASIPAADDAQHEVTAVAYH